ncbi:hypothetical protein [Niabella digestorum]|uniref:DUF996 domain-containing protein n=2 Tax=Chitinophagaceae TaxID=563835 RepID=A0ABU7RCM6_9BACT
MEQQEQSDNILEQEPLEEESSAVLQISRWVKLITSVGFAIGTFIVVVMLTSGAQILRQLAAALPIKTDGIYGALVTGFFMLFFITALILYYLYKAAHLLTQGVKERNSVVLAQGFHFLKKFFIATAILSLVQLLINLTNLLSSI